MMHASQGLVCGCGSWLWSNQNGDLGKEPSLSELPLIREGGLVCLPGPLFPIQGLACLGPAACGTHTHPSSLVPSSKVFRVSCAVTATHCWAEISSGSRCGGGPVHATAAGGAGPRCLRGTTDIFTTAEPIKPEQAIPMAASATRSPACRPG